MCRDQLHEAGVRLIYRAIPIQRGHQEPAGGAAPLDQRDHQRLHRWFGPIPGRQFRIRSPVEFDQHRFSARGLLNGPDGTAVGRQHSGCSRVPGGDPAHACQSRVAVVVEEIGQGERKVAQVVTELAVGEGQTFFLGANHAGVGSQVPQRGHPPLTEDPLGVLADHAQHADNLSLVVAQRTVGERVVGLLRVAGALQEQQQPLIPGGLLGRQHPIDSRADVVPDLRPHLVGGPAKRPRVLAAKGVASVGGVAEEGQLGAPRHPHRKTR